MLALEFKAYGKPHQFSAIDEGIRVTQFIRNKAIRLWMDGRASTWVELFRYCAVLAKEYEFVDKLNSMARQTAADRAWTSISRFYKNCQRRVPGKKGFPTFQNDCRSVEYKTCGWKLSDDRKSITFTDKLGIGRLKMKGTRDLGFYSKDQIKRVRLVRRADGYYVQFCLAADRVESVQRTGKAIGLDVGLKEFYTDSDGVTVANPRFLRRSEKRLKRSLRLVTRKVKGSKNRNKARISLDKLHLKISRQRKDFVVKTARCVITSNDVVVYENLRISDLVKNRIFAKSINDASWYQFRLCLEYFGKVFGRTTIAVNPSYTSQECSNCGAYVKKSLSVRTHTCPCGCVMDRDRNAALNILKRGLSTVGHTGTCGANPRNAWGDQATTSAGRRLLRQVRSRNQETPLC
jgi:putative transposase